MKTTRLLLPFAFAAALSAQANDYIAMRLNSGTSGAPPTLSCGLPFSCTPPSFTVAPGAPVDVIVLAQLNGLYAIGASFDVANMVCVPLGPGFANSLALNPGNLLTVLIGVCAQSDNGRCNGGTTGVLRLFTVPAGIPPGALAFQAIGASPLSAGGNGLAFSIPVVMNF
jgi:hypothetical protein